MDKKILISCGVSSRDWILPYYLKHIYNLDYNKKLIDIYWIVNNSNDNSLNLLHEFRQKYKNEYNSIHIEIYNNSEIPAETRTTKIREEYVYAWLSIIRNKILKMCIKLQCDYLLSSDSDILVSSDTLNRLLSHNLPIVSALIYNGYLHATYEEAYKYPNILKKSSIPLPESQIKLSTDRRYKHIVNYRTKHPEKNPVGKLIEWDFTGACDLMSVDVCKSTKYGWSVYGEDEVWSYEARKNGFHLYADISLYNNLHCMTKDVLEYFIKNSKLEEI